MAAAGLLWRIRGNRQNASAASGVVGTIANGSIFGDIVVTSFVGSGGAKGGGSAVVSAVIIRNDSFTGAGGAVGGGAAVFKKDLNANPCSQGTNYLIPNSEDMSSWGLSKSGAATNVVTPAYGVLNGDAANRVHFTRTVVTQYCYAESIPFNIPAGGGILVLSFDVQNIGAATCTFDVYLNYCFGITERVTLAPGEIRRVIVWCLENNTIPQEIVVFAAESSFQTLEVDLLVNHLQVEENLSTPWFGATNTSTITGTGNALKAGGSAVVKKDLFGGLWKADYQWMPDCANPFVFYSTTSSGQALSNQATGSLDSVNAANITTTIAAGQHGWADSRNFTPPAGDYMLSLKVMNWDFADLTALFGISSDYGLVTIPAMMTETISRKVTLDGVTPVSMRFGVDADFGTTLILNASYCWPQVEVYQEGLSPVPYLGDNPSSTGPAIFYAKANDGGLVAGGSAIVSAVIGSGARNDSFPGSGGSVGGGTATFFKSMAPVPLGGAIGGGLADFGKQLVAACLGGMILGGAALKADSLVAKGGAVGSGAAVANIALVPQPSGGAIGGGAATIVTVAMRSDSFTGAGGAVGGGAADFHKDLNPTPLGGSVCSGSAIANMALVVSPTGGAALGGAAIFSIAMVEAPGGGAVGSGSAIVAMAMVEVPSGGAIGGGSATKSEYFNPTSIADSFQGIGGAVVGGAADFHIDLVGQISGSLIGSGSAIVSQSVATFNPVFVGSGGAIGSGAAPFGKQLSASPQGGGAAGGSAAYFKQLYAIGNGGLIGAGAAAKTVALVAQISGGIQAGGAAQFDKGSPTLPSADRIIEVPADVRTMAVVEDRVLNIQSETLVLVIGAEAPVMEVPSDIRELIGG
jgi:hypothetical protein